MGYDTVISAGVSQDMADLMLAHVLDGVSAYLRTRPWWSYLTESQQRAMTMLAYWAGPQLEEKGITQALVARDIAAACNFDTGQPIGAPLRRTG